jgi:hypothetical protein
VGDRKSGDGVERVFSDRVAETIFGGVTDRNRNVGDITSLSHRKEGEDVEDDELLVGVPYIRGGGDGGIAAATEGG